MKIRAFFILALITCGILATAFIVKATRTSADVKAITEAIKKQDTAQLIQALITRMSQQMEKDDEVFPELIKEVEEYAAQCSAPAGKAVLHSMVAQMYNNYYVRNSRTINQRTNLSGYVPEDIREWTSNLFTDKIKEELTASLQPAGILQQTPVSTYNAILEKGKDSPELRPTLYDFLAFRAIDIQPAQQWYTDLLAFRRTQPDKKALLLDELDYLAFKYQNLPQADPAYENALDSLYQLYGNVPFGAEISIARLNLLERSSYQGTQAHQDSMRTAIFTLCKESIARYPGYARINLLKNRLNEMERPVLNILRSENNVYPGKNLTFKLQYNNIPTLKIRIYKSLHQPQMAWKRNKKEAKQARGELVKEVTYNLKIQNSYTQADTCFAIPMDKLGLYEYEISTPDKKLSASANFSVSRLGSLNRASENKTEVLVTDLESGKPIEGATVIYYRTNMKNGNPEKSGQAKTDKDGLAILPNNEKVTLYRPVFREDTASVPTTLYPYGTASTETAKENIELSIFTDRGIYRPGQTLFFKGIAYVKDTDNPHTVANRTFTVSLRDANFKEIASKTLTTNKFGSFNGEFTIPGQTLSGTYSINSERTNVDFKVEEYKRPSFKVNIDQIKETVIFGKPVTIKGNAETFSGIALQTGEVNWQIKRQPFWLRLYMPNPFNFSDEQVASGITSINNKGQFELSFVPQRQETSYRRSAFQSYEVTATITDSKGETQEARYTFSVGDTGILLQATPKEQKMEQDRAQVDIVAYTVNGEKVQVEGTYKIYSLQDKPDGNTIFGTEKFNINKEVASGNFSTSQPIVAPAFRNLPSGRYRIEVKVTDSKQSEVTAESDFILYDRKDKRPPVFSHTWLIENRTTCLPGEEAEFVFGTSDKQTHILYEIFDANNQCKERKYIELSDENKTFRIPFKAEYGNGFTASFTFVKEGKVYITQVPVKRTQPNRALTIRPETFRDHLLPGSKENWKFRITDADSMAVSAEVLASMYDASLDRLYPFGWFFAPERYIQLFAPRFTGGNAFTSGSQYEVGDIQYLKIPQFQYDKINWQNVLTGNRLYAMTAGRGMMMKSAVANAPVMAENTLAQDRVTDMIAEEEVEDTGTALYSRIQPEPVQIRENFAETAFFYPALVTDEAGNVAFSFTMPESNTTWKLQLLAQTVELKYGYLSKEIITSKPLMVQPNLPRFLRQGDEVTLSAQISNQSGERMEGRARLELFDPYTDQPIVCLTKSQKPFSLDTDSTTTFSWTFTVPAVADGLAGCRIIAESDKGSDGEQHLIPVLSDQILITESTPFYLFDKNEQTILLNKGNKPFRLTLEMTANPIWYAVQALPTVTQPDNDNIISWFAAYYSNTLASHIAAANPRIQQIISGWKAKGGTASTLYSTLQKNEELKNILLQETPWILAADNETEQKQRLSLLFDMNRANQLRETALQKLLQQQTPDGGWSWFKGMFPSREITQYILKGMSQLTELGTIEYNQQEKEMQIKALNYLDKQIQNEYEQSQKNNPNWQKQIASPQIVDYLYVRSAYRDIPELGSAREAIRFYTASVGKSWDKQSLYEKGETAILMHRNGKKDVANAILAWLRKTATTTPDKGMYWANNRNENSYFISPIDVHCLLMSAFRELSSNEQEIDRMKQWLLSRKQTQNWETVPATVNAIYALLLTGSDWLNDNNTCIAQWGPHTYSTAEGETATGYLKITVSDEKELVSDGNSISIRKEGSTPAWGAVYEQYFQNINQVKKQKGVLNVEKMLFIEDNNGSQKQLRPITTDQPLRVGDKVVVRLTVRSDRDMDYVFLKDLRAGCFEPANQLSGSIYRDGAWYYQSPTDVSENFFFNRLSQGTYVLEYSVYVSRTGRYSGGISTIQCLYAPEFVSHTEGNEVIVK